MSSSAPPALTIVDRQSVDLSNQVDRLILDDNVAGIFELAPLLAALSTVEYCQYRARLKEHFKRRLSMTDLDRVVKEARKDRKRAALRLRAHDARPLIQVNGQLRDTVQACLDVLAEANKENPSLFVRDGQLVAIRLDERQGPTIAPLTEHALRYRLSQIADFVSARATADDIKAIPVDPPLDAIRILLDGINPADYPFPALAGITELPIVHKDGSIRTEPGYDAETSMVYIPGELRIPAIALQPTAEDVARARAVLDFWLADFPFSDEASRATAMADAITAIIRPIIEGQVPLTLLDAPKQGTGKTILAQGIGILATGRIVPTNSPTNDDEEWRKRIATWLQASPAIVIIDNLIHPLESSSLNAAITSPYVQDRELGSNRLINVPNRAIWFASGNNIRVGDDTARRCIKCRLDAHLERPWQRTAFRIPGGVKGFFDWTLQHRAELITAILTLARYWYTQGKPAPALAPLGSFEDWTIIIGGILHCAGVPGFLDNLSGADGDSAVDEITAEWRAFTEAMYTAYMDVPFTCSDLAKRMLCEDEEGENLRDTLPAALTKNFDGYRKSQGMDKDFPTHLGHAMRTRRDQIYGELRLQTAGKDRLNKVLWQVAKMEISADAGAIPDEAVY